jgi:glutamyl-tRNA synthetase
VLPPPPAGVQPVMRFWNPLDGVVAWDDLVKGRIEIANAEMDDLIIARADGTPTYNFCVVVDDWDMGITQVIRGDDHVNNTPRQINILKALGAVVPQYAHLSMILGDDGQKLSKRHGAVSVTQYDDDGYLPEAVINYLARLGWSHGDDEIFTREQLVEWFDLDHITPSAAQFNTEKLNWLNAHYIKQADDGRLAADVSRRLARRGVNPEAGPALEAIIALYKDRSSTLNVLADAAELFYIDLHPAPETLAQHLTDVAREALATLRGKLADVAWEKAALAAAIKETCAAHGLKMPQVAIPLRVALLGQPQTPSIDAVLETMGRELVLDLAVADAYRVAIAPGGGALLLDDPAAAVFHAHGDLIVGDRAGALFHLVAGESAQHGAADARQLLAGTFTHLVTEHTPQDGATDGANA